MESDKQDHGSGETKANPSAAVSVEKASQSADLPTGLVCTDAIEEVLDFPRTSDPDTYLMARAQLRSLKSAAARTPAVQPDYPRAIALLRSLRETTDPDAIKEQQESWTALEQSLSVQGDEYVRGLKDAVKVAQQAAEEWGR